MLTFSFVLLQLSIILVLLIFTYVVRIKNKDQIHYAFLVLLSLMLVWSLGQLFEVYTRKIVGHTIMFFVYMYHIGVIFTPVTFLFLGLIYYKNNIKITKPMLLLLLPPVASYVALLTNSYHKSFYERFSNLNTDVKMGPLFFIFHNIPSYIFILSGLGFLLYFSIKNSGFFSKQCIVIFAGFSVPFIVNILTTIQIIKLPTYSTCITFTITCSFLFLAIFKYKFLGIVPIAFQTIFDNISDAVLVVNKDLVVIDFNKVFIDFFSPILKNINRDIDLISLGDGSNECVNKNLTAIRDIIIKDESKPHNEEIHIQVGNFNKYFSIGITHLTNKFNNRIGTVILINDQTEQKQMEARNLQDERLKALGQLIGGIAHNMRTPIMSLSGAVEALKDLSKEYKDSIDDDQVTKEDHHEIANEIQSWVDKMKPYISYMSDMISAVKGQAVQMNASNNDKFTLEELVKRVDILMQHELKTYHCRLETNVQTNLDTEIKGEANTLIQIINNLIVNAIHSYEGQEGIIEFTIMKNKNYVEFIIRDFGRGMSKDVQDKLFKEMITTKGKKGTGLGLYMSYSTIKGRFNGDMRFQSEEDKGTAFYIYVPYITGSAADKEVEVQ